MSESAGGKVLAWSLAVALAGFLFGFDTSVISGAEASIKALWHLSSYEHGFTISVALIGTVFGALFGGIPADRYGRRNTLVAIAVLYLVSAVGAALAPTWIPFLVARFVGGLGVGASSVAAPLYISEIAAAKSRGRLVGLFQFNIVFGIIVAYLSNYVIASLSHGDVSWRWMLGIQAVPSVAFLAFLTIVPESPRWLLRVKGDRERALATLRMIEPDTAEATVDKILAERAHETKGDVALFSKEHAKPIALAMLFAFFNQTSGINAILYYAPRIFGMAHLDAKASLLSSVGVGAVNFVFTLTAVNIMDRFGRRSLMLVGSVGLIITLTLVALAFHGTIGGALVPALLFTYIAFFAFSQGAVIWVFISEIFPNAVRGKGQALGSFTHWFMAAVITFTFPVIAEKFGGTAIFGFFAVMMVAQLVFVIGYMPETKGTSLEAMDTVLLH
ncbi:MAG: sugar porter family MFS transporter [Polyangia bacterium]